MNERIKELAEQAAKDKSDGYPVTLEYSNKFAEKFALLIVRECIKVYEHDPSIYHEVNIVKILEHFGVE